MEPESRVTMMMSSRMLQTIETTSDQIEQATNRIAWGDGY